MGTILEHNIHQGQISFLELLPLLFVTLPLKFKPGLQGYCFANTKLFKILYDIVYGQCTHQFDIMYGACFPPPRDSLQACQYYANPIQLLTWAEDLML